MEAALLGVEVLILLAMIAVSIKSLRGSSEEDRVRARLGATGMDFTMSRKSAAAMWPVIGAIVVLGSWLASDEQPGLPYVGVLLVAFLLGAQHVSLRR